MTIANATDQSKLQSRLDDALDDNTITEELRTLLSDAKEALAAARYEIDLLRRTQFDHASTRSRYEDAYFNLLAQS